MGIAETVREYIMRHRMIRPGMQVCAGFSGGADSLGMLLILQELSGKMAFRLSAVHVNHCLRGAESDADEAFVRSVCEARGIPLFVYTCPVADLAAARRISTEEAGRAARQEVFADCCAKHGADRIALAHHADDNAETMLFHMARGTSLAGAAGIPPVSGNIIHPMLCLRRKEIEARLYRDHLAWRTDSTNLEDDASRNRIRHHVVPVLEEQVNGEAVAHLLALAEDLREADAYLGEEAARKTRQYLSETEEGLLLQDDVLREAAALRGRIILNALGQACGRRRDLGRTQAGQVADLLEGGTGRTLDLPYGVRAVRDYGGVLFLRPETGADSIAEIPVTAAGGEAVFGGYRFRWSVLPAEIQAEYTREPAKIPQKRYTKWLDYDKMGTYPVLRFRKSGDFLETAPGRHRKLKDYLIDEKVPARARPYLPLLASDREIFWVVGYRISEHAKLTPRTRQILEIIAEPLALQEEILPG